MFTAVSSVVNLIQLQTLYLGLIFHNFSSRFQTQTSVPPHPHFARSWVWIRFSRPSCYNNQYLLAFVAYCPSWLKLPHNTIKGYLAGIQHFISLLHPGRPSVFAAHAFKAILKGIQKCNPPSPTNRLPVTGHVFRGMSDILSRSPLGLLPSLTLKAAIYLAFYGFLRPGGFTCTGA